jgi:hypothetical protein
MSYSNSSSYCNPNARNCRYDCCSRSGSCPSRASNCYYYYGESEMGLSAGAIAGIAIGGIVFLFIMIYIIYCQCRARKLNMTLD